jgi:hypothetical protein
MHRGVTEHETETNQPMDTDSTASTAPNAAKVPRKTL